MTEKDSPSSPVGDSGHRRKHTSLGIKEIKNLSYIPDSEVPKNWMKATARGYSRKEPAINDLRRFALIYINQTLNLADAHYKKEIGNRNRQVSLLKSRLRELGVKSYRGGLGRGVIGKARALKFEQSANNKLRREISHLETEKKGLEDYIERIKELHPFREELKKVKS